MKHILAGLISFLAFSICMQAQRHLPPRPVQFNVRPKLPVIKTKRDERRMHRRNMRIQTQLPMRKELNFAEAEKKEKE